jgi:hypothetical protein
MMGRDTSADTPGSVTIDAGTERPAPLPSGVSVRSIVRASVNDVKAIKPPQIRPAMMAARVVSS